MLRESNIDACAFSNLRDLAVNLDATTACVILVEEALISDDLPVLRKALDNLPTWSDLPLIVVAHDIEQMSHFFIEAFPNSGNVTLLERPLNLFSLVSAVRVGLRATARQRQMGELAAEREKAIKLRDEFLAMLAHELRNPLVPMVNAVYMLREMATEDSRTRNCTDILERQINHVTRMIDDLMDVARLERSKLTLQKVHVDLNQVVSAAVESSFSSACAKGHTLRCDLHSEPLPVFIDVVRIEQVVCNLINNAIKFTQEPNSIYIATSKENGLASISVKDNGIGFEPEIAPTLFAPFIQINSTLARSTGGLGIGLTIVQRLAELHGGSVNAVSAGLGHGARFIVSLPIAAGKPAAMAVSIPAPTEHIRRRIVVVEDNPDIRETLRAVIKLWGHDVFVADNGSGGIELIQRERPEIALIDVGLPKMDGYQVARAIKAQIPRGIKLIAVTGYGQPADKTAALEAGFDHFLLKPVEPELLRNLLAINF